MNELTGSQILSPPGAAAQPHSGLLQTVVSQTSSHCTAGSSPPPPTSGVVQQGQCQRTTCFYILRCFQALKMCIKLLSKTEGSQDKALQVQSLLSAPGQLRSCKQRFLSRNGVFLIQQRDVLLGTMSVCRLPLLQPLPLFLVDKHRPCSTVLSQRKASLSLAQRQSPQHVALTKAQPPV